MKIKFKLGVIGVGIMASSILDGLINNIEKCDFDLKQISVFDVDRAKLNRYEEMGINLANNVSDIAENCEYVMLCIKPQNFEEVALQFNHSNCQHIISIMAGVKISTIANKLSNKNLGITRVMPNLACKIGKGVAALAFYNESNTKFATQLFSFCGKVLAIDEEKFDAVTSISGSGPSYVFMFADALIKAGMNGGLTFEESKLLSLATIDGANSLALSATEDLGTLINNVCSKGGTTIEAVDSFKKDNLYEIIDKGVRLCREKSEILSKKY